MRLDSLNDAPCMHEHMHYPSQGACIYSSRTLDPLLSMSTYSGGMHW